MSETEKWDKAHAALGHIFDQTREAGAVWRRLQKTVLAKDFGAKTPDIHRQVGELGGKLIDRDRLLARARTATAYRRSLAHTGLNISDVEGHFWDFVPGKGRCITDVRTKDGQRVKLRHPVPISEARALVGQLLLS